MCRHSPSSKLHRSRVQSLTSSQYSSLVSATHSSVSRLHRLTEHSTAYWLQSLSSSQGQPGDPSLISVLVHVPSISPSSGSWHSSSVQWDCGWPVSSQKFSGAKLQMPWFRHVPFLHQNRSLQ